MTARVFDAAALEELVGRRVSIGGHFVGSVTVDAVEDLGQGGALAGPDAGGAAG